MDIVRGNSAALAARVAGTTIDGTAWGIPILDHGDELRLNHVHFAPAGRTRWHSHAAGQILLIVSGRGRVGTRDSEHEVSAGDIVYTPPGEEHWHGAAPDSPLHHVAITFGATSWLESVAD